VRILTIIKWCVRLNYSRIYSPVVVYVYTCSSDFIVGVRCEVRKRERETHVQTTSVLSFIHPFVLWSSFEVTRICGNGRSDSHISRKGDNKIWPHFVYLSTNLGEIRYKVLPCYNNNDEGWFSEILTVINDENDIFPIFYKFFFPTWKSDFVMWSDFF